jgi:hypothetical protein
MNSIIATNGRNKLSQKFNPATARAFVVAGFLLCASGALAQSLPPGWKGSLTNTPLDSWSFHDNTNWTSDLGYAPVSFTNLSFSNLGDGASLVVDSPDPAWLQYNVYENDGTTNLTVDQGTVTLWFAPDWSGTNQGGTGPGEWGRLIEVGGYTPDSSYGWWSLYVDDGGNNLYFSTQTNDLSSNVWTYLSVPVSWTTNYFHFIALTYSATNTALYLDGVLATNGPPLTVYPDPKVLANGFYLGSDSTGVLQAHGLFNTLATYSYPLDSNAVQQIFNWEYNIYVISPWNIPFMDALASAPSSPQVTPTFVAITGPGYLTPLTNTLSCVTSSNVWMTNMVATPVTNGTMNLTFTIAGGSNGYPYDVFATSALVGRNITNAQWAWMGQGYQCTRYLLTNLPSSAALLILGTPQDTDQDGLTDAYELLVSHTNPLKPDSSGDGMLDGWKVLWGLNPSLNNPAQTGQRANFTYYPEGWLWTVWGVKGETVGTDFEGNIQQAH